MSTTDYLKITFSDEENAVTEHQRVLPFSNSSLYKTRIIDTKQLTSSSDTKRTYSIGIDIQNIEHQFQPGDTIGILPENDTNEVELLLKRLDLTSVGRKTYRLEILKDTLKKNAAVPQHLPNQGTLLEVFLRHLDIRTPPKKLFLKTLLRFTSEENEIRQLKLLTTPKASEEYVDFIKNHTTLLLLLNAFPSCQPPVERILENLGPLQPRPYSISSSPLAKELRVTFSVIESGVCTGWLEKLIVSNCSLSDGLNRLNLNAIDYLSFYFRKSNNFRLPHDPKTPIIMIGPGTGIAPFIGFLQHRELGNTMFNIEFGSSWLFYGCRYLSKDFLYKSEIDKYLKNGVLTKLFSCSSREGPKKLYVQDLIRENSQNFVNQIVKDKAIVYVCGDAKNMMKDVKNTIISCIEECMEWPTTQADLFVKELKDSNRYIEDSWL
ncbi:hypothetical protein RN001_004600 [Aquatica leii]|uniref:Methionine synthase reductase n=1 Tax=Aquatica leii TaxID=1421715 RepID=A0AAN7SA65_9COLE|nr:hypothetical protein RN001_004600 [Aquatica leii]